MTVRAAATVRRKDEATTEMANTPQKTKDATEEALTAIQEALSVRAPEPRAGAPYGANGFYSVVRAGNYLVGACLLYTSDAADE